MKNTPLHIEENELDVLLRQFVLDGNPDEFTQNTMTMNADMIFNNAPQLAPDAAREMALIQKLENAFIKRRGFGKFWLNGIIFLFIISAAVWIYKANSGNTIVASQHNGKNTNTFSPVSADDTADATKKLPVQETDVQGIFILKPMDTTEEFSDTTFKQSPPPKKERFVTPDSHMDVGPFWYDGNYIMEDVPGPVFSAKASPENYKLAQGVFNVLGENIMFTCKQDSFVASYYTGEPFKSGMSDMRYFNYGEYAQTAQMEQKKETMRIQTTLFPWVLPWAIMEYADPDEMKVETVERPWNNEKRSYTWLFMHKIPEKGIELAMSPFYFRKYEVTNKEYREFVNWVRTANGYANKPIMAATIDTVEITDPKDRSGEQIMIKNKKYRIVRKTVPTEDFKEVFNYIFFNKNSKSEKSSMYIFPDTTSWITDFTFSYNEPMRDMYFWHPAYDNYPVVGVSWYQAMAFLDWKTHMHQQQLNAEKIPYEIEYTLPSDIEWELTSTSIELGKNTAFAFYYDGTQDWMTNLGVSHSERSDPYQRTNYLKNLFTKDQYFRGDYIRDGYFHTGQADLSHLKVSEELWGKHIDPFGISWMDGNVSEWMIESYAENWKPFFQKHLAILEADTSESTKLARQIEVLYDKGNAANGRLVRGANWYDERFGGRPTAERNDAGINPKRFIDPSEQHSTIGFRYVVHVKRK